MNFNGKTFRALQNVASGDVSDETRFYYHQVDDYLWGSYSGGGVSAGVLIGKVIEEIKLDFHYAHYDKNGQYRTGHCQSKAEVVDGRIRLYEEWQWTNGDQSRGSSIIEEVKK